MRITGASVPDIAFIFSILRPAAIVTRTNLLFRARSVSPISASMSQIGDLTFSLIKRHSGIKDYSSVLKGHGGIMDRFDSVCFAAPLVELMVTIAAVFTTTSLI